MSTIQVSANLVHYASTLSVTASKQYTSSEPAFTAGSITVTTSDETVQLGEVVEPKYISLKHISGDELRVGFDGTNYPIKLFTGDTTLLCLDPAESVTVHLKSIGETQLVVAVAPA